MRPERNGSLRNSLPRPFSMLDKWRSSLSREQRPWNEFSDDDEDGNSLVYGEASKRENLVKELVQTERRHVIKLRILHNLFYTRIQAENLLSEDQMKKLFINHLDVLQVHEGIYQALKKCPKKRSKEIAKTVNQIFKGSLGKRLDTQLSIFCSSHKGSYGYLKDLRTQNQEFSELVEVLQQEKDCRGEQLANILASCFQRVTKYPLITKELISESDEGSEEYHLLKSAMGQMEQILRNINSAVKREEMKDLLITLRGSMEQSTRVAVDILLRENTLVHAGDVLWVLEETKGGKKRRVKVKLILGIAYVFILTVAQNEMLLLKHHSSSDSKSDRNLILPLDELIVRNVAGNKCSFYVISSAVYEFIADSVESCNQWMLAIGQAKEELKIKTIHSLLADTTNLISEFSKDSMTDELKEKMKMLRQAVNSVPVGPNRGWFWRMIFSK